MKKELGIGLIVYVLLMIFSFVYCGIQVDSLNKLFINTLIYSAIVVCIVLSTVLFVKSEHGNNLGIIPKKYYLYIVACFLIVVFFQAFVSMMKTHVITRASMFLPCLLGIVSTYCFKKKFRID